MAKYSITAIVGAVTDKLEAGLKKAKASAKSFGKSAGGAMSGLTSKTKGAFNQISAFGTKFQGAMGHPAVQAVTAAGKAIGEFGMEAVQTAGKIDASMNEVFTLLPQMATGAKDKMTKEMMELSAEMGKMPDDMIGSLYNALSAGIPKENVFEFLKTASKASIGGVSSTEEAVGALTTVLNGYKMPAKEAGQVSDTLFTIIKNGVTTMPELAANIGKVTPIAASLGLSFDQVGASFAELTKNLGPGKSAETGTMLKAMFAELSKSGSDAAEAFERISGKSFPDFIKGGGTLREAMIMMQKDADKSGARITDLFGSIEAGQAALILAQNGAKGLGEQMEEMGKKSGAATTAYKTVDQGFARMMQKLMSGLEMFKYTVGKALGPLVDVLMPMLSKGLKMISDLPWNSVGDVLGQIAKAYEPLQDAIFELVKELFPLIPSLLKIMLMGLSILMPMIVLLVKILAKLMPIVVWIVDKIAAVADLISTVYGWITRLIASIFDGGDAVKAELKGIKTESGDLFKTIGGWWSTIKGWWDSLMGFFGATKTGLSEIIDAVAYAADMLWTLVKWPFQQIWKVITTTFDLIKLTIQNAFDFIMNLRQRMIDKIFEIFPWLEGLINWAKEKILAVHNWIIDTMVGAVNWIKETVLGLFKAIWSVVDDYVMGIYYLIKEKLEELWNQFMTSNNKVIEALRFFYLFGKEVFDTLAAMIKKAIGLFEKVGDAIGWVAEKLGLASEETENLNEKVRENEGLQKKSTKAVEETTKAKEGQAKAETAVAMAQAQQNANAEAGVAIGARATAQAAAKAKAEEQAALNARMAALAQKEYVKTGAKIIMQSGVHVGQLNAAIKKHKGINNLGQAYEFIAAGKMTPAQIIEEAFPKAQVLNREGGKFTIKDPKGQTPSEQIKKAIPAQGKLNEEAGNNPMLKLQKGEMKVTCSQGDNKDIKIIIQQIALVHRDLLGIDKTLKGKFVNQ